MAAGKEIRVKIKSVQNTQKITRAMEMVAASKMRKAQNKMAASRPYTEKMRTVVAHLSQAHPEYKHPYMLERPVKRIGLIVISSDRGLCGGLNANLFRATLAKIQAWKSAGIECDVCPIGNKSISLFKRLDVPLVSHIGDMGDNPSIADLIGAVKSITDRFNDNQVDEVYLAYNMFVNTMTQQPHIDPILPIQTLDKDDQLKTHWDYIYEQDSKDLLDSLLARYIESLVYQGVVENLACEQSARMVAMKSASDNAGDLISDLQLEYNKARQASITQELSEIIGGAAAV
jgi:F-type H+-transporting ATPase subunit gamma